MFIGSLLIEANSKAQSEKNVECKNSGCIQYQNRTTQNIEYFQRLETCFDLKQILEGLKDKYVGTVQRFVHKRMPTSDSDVVVKFTGSLMLTFDRPEISSMP